MTKGLPRVFFAIGIKSMEEFLKKQLSKEFQFVGEAIYREAVVNNAFQCNPDIIILRETLSGSKNILDIVYEIRLQLPDARIVFLASDRKPGDPLLAELVGNGVYDILVGNKLSAPEIIDLIREPNKFSDVAMYKPKMTIDQKTNEPLFEAPPVKEVVKHVKQTVFVEGETPPILPESYGKKEKEEPKKETEKPKLKRNRRRFFKSKETATQKPIEIPEEIQDEPVFELPKIKIDFDEEEKEVVSNEKTSKLPTFKNDLPKTEEQPRKENIVSEPPVIKFDIPEDESKEEIPKNTPSKEPTLPKVSTPEATTEKIEIIDDPPKQEDKQVVNRTPKKSITPSFQNETFVPVNSKQKILTFVGGDYGVGNSQIAYNTAITLGKRGFKTIFIELKEEGSTIEYLYQLALSNKGLDYAMKNLLQEDFTGIEESIIRIDEVKRQNRNAILDDAYKKFPNNVDYLFFSPDYILENDPEQKQIDPSLLKELCMHLFFQLGYHYIVLDAEPNLFNPFSEVALSFGTHIFYTITQDVCHIGRAVRNISEINKRINIVEKLYYIVNKFDHQASLSKKDIEDWLKAEVESVVPMLYKDFINANMNGLPILISSKDKNLKKSFEEIVNHILQK